ncbi:MAG: hypothetical protein J1F32_01745 [Erysipelotrichales bacterium]|nr:hypothetical protein [Erysipelotrichales bacterium]
MGKKCLACNNIIDKANHYVCNDCYKEIRSIKDEYLPLRESTLKKEYSRWLRNLNLTRNPIYKKEYQLKVIAIAEVMNDKYRNNRYITNIIDYSNNQTASNNITIKKDEEIEEQEFNEQNKDPDVDLKNYSTYKKCNDGHRVISKSEKIIDDLLTEKGIRHYYDMEIDDNTNYRYDFYLPDYKIYIEHWGFKDRENYEIRKRNKLEYYKSNDYILVESDEETINDRHNLIKALRKVAPNIFSKKSDKID